MNDVAGRGAVSVQLGSGSSSQVRLSPMQRALWTSQRLDPDQPMQNMALVSHIDGLIDPYRLAAAFDRVIAASDVLQTRLTRSGEGEVATVGLVDDGGFSEVTQCSLEEIRSIADERCRQPLDLSQIGFDSVIASHEDGTCSWFLNLHHVITDATSSALVFAATASAYEGAEVVLDSYYQWVEQHIATRGDGPRLRRAQDHWSNRAEATRIDWLYEPVPATSGRKGSTSDRFELDLDSGVLSDVAGRLEGDYKMLSVDLGWTVVLTTAMAVYLHRVSGAKEFSVGLPMHQRSGPEVAELVGPLVELFPVDVAIDPTQTYRELHRQVGRSVLRTLQNAAPGLSPRPDFDAVVNVISRAQQNQFGPHPVTTEWLHPGAVDSSHLLRLQMSTYSDHATDGGAAGQLRFELDVNHRVGDSEARGRAVEHLGSVVAALVADPDVAISSLNLCTPTEQSVLKSWGTAPPLSSTAHSAASPVIVRLMERLAASETNTAGRAALVQGDREYSGAELQTWIASTGRWLQESGAQPGDRIGINLDRSAEAVVAIMATLWIGCSFVPLDPKQPEARRQRLIERSGCALVLSDRNDVANQIGGSSAQHVERPQDAEAYLLFTSGSTGEPKGVAISRLGLDDYVAFAAHAYGSTEEADLVAPLFSALTFDLTITTLFVPLLLGGKLVVIEADGPSGLADIARIKEISWAKATPSHLEILVQLLDEDHQLRTLIVGGEAFGSRLGRKLTAGRPELRIFNEYGPTEAVVGCMIYQAEPDMLETLDDVPIGAPAPGVTLRILDGSLQPVPLGASGELYIHHRGMASAYLGDVQGDAAGAGSSEASKSPFLEIDGLAFYRTGDVVRLHDAERLIYMGRIDEQVKVGGIRLEPREVEAALDEHPNVKNSAVRLWSPSSARSVRPAHHCTRCGLPDNVPGVVFDADGVCGTCHEYDRVSGVASGWFKNPDDLRAELATANGRATGDYDVLALLSGGKDSTYALYKLVELGARPFALTLDNGFISEGAKENVRRSVADLGIDHEFMTTDAMNEIFADSLAVHSNVCHGCYKTIYTLATNKAVELGIPLIVTGLSRGQLFETRLIPQQFSVDRFDPDAIDRAVLQARKIYHRAPDAVQRTLDTSVFETDDVFDDVRYLDFYRYLDVELSEMFEFLETTAPWVRPADTGRSTNCLVNAAGIYTHLYEQGYHNYAEPYAWDVRLGHKTRAEAIEELDDELDLDDINSMLETIGYRPIKREVLTAWIEVEDSQELSPSELRSFLADRVPSFAVPSAFVTVDELPLTVNGKLAADQLPAPERVHRSGSGLHVPAATETEAVVISVWETSLGVEPIGVDDDFFSLGGDSLAALEMILSLGDRLERVIPEDIAFRNTTPRQLAAAIEAGDFAPADSGKPDSPSSTVIGSRSASQARSPRAITDKEVPRLSVGQRGVLFDQEARPDDVMYNVARVFRLDAQESQRSFDEPKLRAALEAIAERHDPLCWTYGSNRRRLSGAEAVSLVKEPTASNADVVEANLARAHREPFDLENGPLLRAVLQPSADGSLSVLLAVHHVSADAKSFEILWSELNEVLAGNDLEPLPISYADYSETQQRRNQDSDREHWISANVGSGAKFGFVAPADSVTGNPDGFVTQVASVSAAELAVEGATTFAAALTSLSRTLRSYCRLPEDADGVEIGLIASTRDASAAASLVGYFLNTVPLVLSDDTATMRANLGQTLAHRSYPLAQLLADRRAEGLPNAVPSVLVAYDDVRDVAVGTSSATQRVLSNGSAVADATFFIENRGGYIDISLEYRGSVMTQGQAVEVLTQFDRNLARASSTFATSLLVGDPLAPRHDRGLTVPAICDRAARTSTFSGPAVECGAESLSWSELDSRSRSVASRLISSGLSQGDRVVAKLDRSVELVVAMLGILRAGGTYVPVDPSYPPARVRQLTQSSQAGIVLTNPSTSSTTGVEPQISSPAEIIEITSDGLDADSWETLNGRSSSVALPTIQADWPAYVIFTSGSTGEPKPVQITHGQLSSSTNARLQFYGELPGASATEAFRFLMVSSPSFDSSIVGLFWTLLEGGTIVMPDASQIHDVEALGQLLEADVTHTLMVPSLYQGLLDGLGRRGERRPVSRGRWWPPVVIVAGEACSAALVDRHYKLFPNTSLVNEYGPTEATVWATAYETRFGQSPVPIGRPIPGSWLAVVDSDQRLCPVGVAGQIVLGGPGVASDHGEPVASLGSWTSAEQLSGFVHYSGDRGAIVDGQVQYLGRTDNQLNVNGFRVEPEEVEKVLESVPGIEVAAVVAVADQRRSIERLVAYVETRPATAPSTDRKAMLDALRDEAERRLPPLARPAEYVIYADQQRLARTANGKLDRAAISALPLSLNEGPTELSAVTGEELDEATAKLTGIFAECLGRPIGPDDSFFDRGGHSLIAIEVMLAAEDQLGVRGPVSALYRAPTPRALAQVLSVASSDPSSDGATLASGTFLVPIQPNGKRPPIFGIHVLGIDCEFFRPLSARLGDEQPMFGLGQPTNDDQLRLDGPTSVREVAASYVAEIQRAAPSGPLVLSAISLGGVVAFETAQQLVAAGRHVALLALFDAIGPEAADHRLGLADKLRIHSRALREEPVDYLKGRAAHESRRAQRWTELAEMKLRAKLDSPLPHRLEVRRFIEANITDQLDYEFKPYDSRLALFKAVDDPFTEHYLDVDMGWRPVAKGGLSLDVVPGDHITMVAEPNVGDLAKRLKPLLDSVAVDPDRK